MSHRHPPRYILTRPHRQSSGTSWWVDQPRDNWTWRCTLRVAEMNAGPCGNYTPLNLIRSAKQNDKIRAQELRSGPWGSESTKGLPHADSLD
jgi:hypothetical protein